MTSCSPRRGRGHCPQGWTAAGSSTTSEAGSTASSTGRAARAALRASASSDCSNSRCCCPRNTTGRPRLRVSRSSNWPSPRNSTSTARNWAKIWSSPGCRAPTAGSGASRGAAGRSTRTAPTPPGPGAASGAALKCYCRRTPAARSAHSIISIWPVRPRSSSQGTLEGFYGGRAHRGGDRAAGAAEGGGVS